MGSQLRFDVSTLVFVKRRSEARFAGESQVDVFRVQNKNSAAACYYLRAGSASEAIERVTLILEDPEGMRAWSAEPDDPKFDVAKGVLFDRSGKRVKTLEA